MNAPDLGEEFHNKLYKYWRCREEADYLYRQTKDVSEYFWYEFKEVKDCYLFQNSGNWIENPIIRYNKYIAFTNNENVQTTIIFSYMVNESGTIQNNTLLTEIQEAKVLEMIMPNEDSLNINIDGKKFIYGGKTYQEAIDARNRFIENVKSVNHIE